MPKSLRQTLQRDLDRALKSLELAQVQVVKVGANYKEKYPDFYEKYCVAVAGINNLITLLESLRRAI